MREVFIIGVGMTPFGVHAQRSTGDMAREAVTKALADAGATVADVDATFYANTVSGAIEGQFGMKGQHALRPLGIHHLDFPYSPARVWSAIARAKDAMRASAPGANAR